MYSAAVYGNLNLSTCINVHAVHTTLGILVVAVLTLLCSHNFRTGHWSTGRALPIVSSHPQGPLPQSVNCAAGGRGRGLRESQRPLGLGAHQPVQVLVSLGMGGGMVSCLFSL